MPDESWTPAKAQMHLRIQSFSVPVSDLHRSLEFYETTLGFRVLRRHIDVAPGIAFAAVAPTGWARPFCSFRQRIRTTEWERPPACHS